MANPYETLGVSKSASQDEIKKAFKKLARTYHPDINKEPGAEGRFKEVNAAYDAVGDPEKRKLYDEFGEVALKPGFDAGKARAWQQAAGGFQGGGPQGFRFDFGGGEMDMEEFFSNIFGRGGGRAGAGFGGGQARSERRVHPDFSGFGPDFGTGRSRRPSRGSDQEIAITIDAMSAILGAERRIGVRRPNGEVDRLNVRIPAGVKDGGKLRLSGQGLPPPGGGPCGDLIVRLHVAEHPVLRRHGDDLDMDLPLTVLEAMQGAQITVPTPTGDVKVTVPRGAESGQKLRLRGKGVQKKKPGDLYLVLQVRVPESEDEQVTEAAKTLQAAYGDIRATLKL